MPMKMAFRQLLRFHGNVSCLLPMLIIFKWATIMLAQAATDNTDQGSIFL
jgi:hypothetical protein